MDSTAVVALAQMVLILLIMITQGETRALITLSMVEVATTTRPKDTVARILKAMDSTAVVVLAQAVLIMIFMGMMNPIQILVLNARMILVIQSTCSEILQIVLVSQRILQPMG